MKKLSPLILTMLLISFVACKDDGETTTPCIAGTGGNITLNLLPEHHGNPILDATAYIEFNTQTNPGSLSNYDLVVEGHDEHIHIENLKCGNYYIYCEGFDSSISMPVRGGIPFIIQQGATGEIIIHVPVTE